MNKSLIKSAVAHRRLARFAASRLRKALRSGVPIENSTPALAALRAVDANRRCAAMDFAAAKDVAS